MQITIDSNDVDLIAGKVVEQLRPLIACQSKGKEPDEIMDLDEVASYLKVDKSWVYKQVQLGTITVIKCGKYNRFRKSVVDKQLERCTVPASSPFRLPG